MSFSKESDREDVRRYEGLHGGKGVADVRHFRFDDCPHPANFVIFDLPPGASEGVHVHGPADPSEGFLDEYYYIISGTGVMQIDDQIIAVKAGDFVHTPIGTAHGIENTASAGNLKVLVTFIVRQPAE
jgi:quercetin dioxygenase-like cupin family protein